MKRFFRKHYLNFMNGWYIGKLRAYTRLYDRGYIDDRTYVNRTSTALKKSVTYTAIIIKEGL